MSLLSDLFLCHPVSTQQVGGDLSRVGSLRTEVHSLKAWGWHEKQGSYCCIDLVFRSSRPSSTTAVVPRVGWIY